MSTDIIDPNTFTPETVQIPADATQEQWASIHRTVMLCRKASKAWLKRSRAFASERWGIDFVAEAEVQMELALGIEAPKESTKLNPRNKSTAIVTIEGIAQQFVLWHRNMDDEIATWDRPRVEKALGLLRPIGAQIARLEAML